MEPARSTLYRSFLLATTPFLLGFAILFRLPVFLAWAAAQTAVLILAWRSAKRGAAGVTASRRVYPSAFEGDQVAVEITLEADRPAPMLEVADAFGPSLTDEHRMLEPGPLGPGVRRRLQYLTSCSRQWGLYSVGPLQIVASDFMGLFHPVTRLPLIDEFAVFPRVYDVSGLLRLGSRASLASQEATAGRPGKSLSYLGVRDYRPGDEPRRIHWAASARRGGLVVKEYEVDLSPYFTVFLDLDRRHRAGTGRKSSLEYVVRTSSSIVWSAIRAGCFVQVIGEGRKPVFVPPGRGENHLTYALYELLRTAQDGEAPLHEVVMHHLAAVPEDSSVAVVSGTVFVDLGAAEELLEVFRGRGVRPAFILVNNFGFPAIDGWPPKRAEVLERKREVEYFLRSRGVPVRVLEAEDELEAALAGADFGA